jgi:hypothetical protein
MKTKSTKKAKTNRKAIPYQQIARLAEQGFGALEIAKKTNRLIKGNDPAHSIRAILSKMRTSGYRVGEKIVKLKIKRVGFEPKPVRKATVKKTVAPKIDGKTLAAGGGK